MSTEIGVSLLFAPIRFIAAYNTPRFLLDYMFNTVSDTLSILDLFRPGLFASYAITAFTSGSDDEMNFDFFVYQVPSVVVTIVKLIMRRKRLGKEKCRTKRVLGVLFARMLLRAVIPSYSIMIPTQGGELVVASIQLFLEQLCTSYLFRHTWPYEETTPTTIPADE
ncbi:hypothetical protein AGDE_07187 [Angomonas deanei]|nr:hypothetical protein AGDE_07187 [Angomonas deanei]|eukprot:EPY35891.1 hypothetical protein AGDE_07187 [Angomonas deanei]